VTSATYSLSEKDSASYEDGYSIFLSRSNFREKVLEKFSNLASTTFRDRKDLTVLDVGCGNGQMTFKYLAELKKVVSQIELSLLEPAQESLEQASALLKSSVNDLKTISKLPDQALYDLIIASYVFYHLPSDTITRIASQIKPGGSFAIMMGTSEHPLKSHPALKAISAHGSSDKLIPFLNELETTHNFKISRYRVETQLNVKSLWDNNSFTNEAKKLLSFSLNKNFHDLNESSINAINEIFETAVSSNGGYLKSVHEIIWVERLR
jgi:SAM-dependent methyltransferase